MRKHTTHYDDCGCKTERLLKVVKKLRKAILNIVYEYRGKYFNAWIEDVDLSKYIKDALAESAEALAQGRGGKCLCGGALEKTGRGFQCGRCGYGGKPVEGGGE